MSFFKKIYNGIETFFNILAESRMKAIEARKKTW
jgi:hypothetical protein